MKQKIFFAVTQIFYIGWLLLDFADLSSPHVSAFLLSIMPLFPIGGSIFLFQLSFQEWKQNSLRVLSYSFSVFLFLVCLLSFLGIISFTRTADRNISAIHYRSLIAMAYSEFVLLIINMGFLARDSYVRDRGNGRL